MAISQNKMIVAITTRIMIENQKRELLSIVPKKLPIMNVEIMLVTTGVTEKYYLSLLSLHYVDKT